MSSAHNPSSSSVVLDRLLGLLKRCRIISPVRERYLRHHPDEVHALVQELPERVRRQELPDEMTVRLTNSRTRQHAHLLLRHLDRQEDAVPSVSETPIEDRETELVAVPIPQQTEPIQHLSFPTMQAARSMQPPTLVGASFYRWPEEQGYRNLPEMLSEAMLQHMLRHTYKPTQMHVSPKNYCLAYLWKSCEPYRELLVKSAAMTQNSVWCHGPTTEVSTPVEVGHAS